LLFAAANVPLMVRWQVLVVGLPEIVAVPSTLFVKVSFFGKAPFSVMVGTGLPFVVTVNENLHPVVATARF
jgi:hypothetical protein